MNKVFVGVLAVLSGLLFYCPKVEACEVLPMAGFQEFLYGDGAMGNAGYEEINEPKELPAYYISETDKERLLQIASLEAGNQGVDGMAYVMQTVLNRVFDPDFPMTVEGVLFQENQFTTASKLDNANIVDGAEDAFYLVTEGEYKVSEALYFESMPGTVWAGCHEYLFTYEGHDFYK